MKKNNEHFCYEVHLIKDGQIGDLLVEVGTCREAFDIMNFCERHVIGTVVVPYLWFSCD